MAFSCLCCCHSYRSHFFYCTKRINLLILKERLDRLVIVAKVFLKLPNLHILIKQESITSQELGSPDYWWIANSVLIAKVDLLYLCYSTAHRYCLLHLIMQNVLLKTFLRTKILMTQVSLYLFSLLELIWNCIIFLYLPRWLKRS